MAKAKRKPVVKYSDKLGIDICEQLIEGKSLRSICEGEKMPSFRNVIRWLADSEHPFCPHYARAREIQAEIFADELTDIADDGRNDWMDRVNKDGEVIGEMVNHENIQRSKLRIDTRKWIASKMLPKKFGDKGADGGSQDVAALLAAAIARMPD